LLADATKAHQKRLRTGTLTIGTIIGLNIADERHHDQSLEAAIAARPDWRQLLKPLAK
jgi:hypothetical protein